MTNPKQELLDQLKSELTQAENGVAALREKIARLEAEDEQPEDASKRAAISALKTAAWVAPVVVATKLPEMNFAANAQSPCNPLGNPTPKPDPSGPPGLPPCPVP